MYVRKKNVLDLVYCNIISFVYKLIKNFFFHQSEPLDAVKLLKNNLSHYLEVFCSYHDDKLNCKKPNCTRSASGNFTFFSVVKV